MCPSPRGRALSREAPPGAAVGCEDKTRDARRAARRHPGSRVRKRRTTGSFERPNTALSRPVGPPLEDAETGRIGIAFTAGRVAVRVQGSRPPAPRGARFGRDQPQGGGFPENALRENKTQAEIISSAMALLSNPVILWMLLTSNRVLDAVVMWRWSVLSERGPVCVSVINMKGGVGKTTTVALLGRHAAKNLHILVIDLDPQAKSKPSVHGECLYAVS